MQGVKERKQSKLNTNSSSAPLHSFPHTAIRLHFLPPQLGSKGRHFEDQNKMTHSLGVWPSPPAHEGLWAEAWHKERLSQNPGLPEGRELPLPKLNLETKKLHPTHPVIWCLMNLLSTQINVIFPRLTCALLFIKQHAPFFKKRSALHLPFKIPRNSVPFHPFTPPT